MYNNIFTMTGPERAAVYALVISFICYLVYEGIYHAAGEKPAVLIKIRFLGFLLLGIIPAAGIILLTDFVPVSLGFGYKTGTIVFMLRWTAGLSLFALMVTWIRSHSKEHQEQHPGIRDSLRTRKAVMFNIFSWVLYAAGYEGMFMGVILFTASGAFGLWPGVIISSVLYSAVHLPEGMWAAAGTLLLGPVLGVVTILTGSIWIAVVVHSVFAVTNFLFPLYTTTKEMPVQKK